MILPNISSYYNNIVQLTSHPVFDLVTTMISFTGFIMFIIIMPYFLHEFLEIKLSEIKKNIFFIFDIFIFIVITFYFFFSYQAIILGLLISLNGMVFYGIFFILLNIKKVINPYLKKSLIILAIVTIIFLPLFVLDMALKSIFFALPVYYFVINSLAIVFSFQYFNKPPQIKVPIISEKFLVQYKITEREKDVILLFIKGMSYLEIANSLFISYKTVDNHIRNIYQKTTVKNRFQLINLLIENP